MPRWLELVTISLMVLPLAIYAGVVHAHASAANPKWTATFCRAYDDNGHRHAAEPCVATTLSERMYPDVALKAKVVPHAVDNGWVDGYWIFYPEK